MVMVRVAVPLKAPSLTVKVTVRGAVLPLLLKKVIERRAVW